MNSLIESIKGAVAITATTGAAAATDLEGAVFDTQGYDGVLCIVTMGAITSGAVTSLKLQTGTDAAMATAVDVTGSSITVADTDDDKVFALDIRRPLKRYMWVYADRATQNAVIENAVYIGYKSDAQPDASGFDDTSKVANI